MAAAMASWRPALALTWICAACPGQVFVGLTRGKKYIQQRTRQYASQSEIEKNIKLIKELRKDRSAPVDRLGIHVIHKQAEDPCYETLVALILSARTKDAATYDTIQVLRQHGLTPENILGTSVDTLTDLLAKVNHYKKKALYLKETTSMLVDSFDGKVPTTEEDLKKLKGVGEKSALLYLQTVSGKAKGIAVDSHVHTVANSLGWVKTKRAEQTRKELEERLPVCWWSSINPLLVGFGQELATEKSKMIAKCIKSSNPSLALQMLSACGINVTRELETGSSSVKPFRILRGPSKKFTLPSKAVTN